MGTTGSVTLFRSGFVEIDSDGEENPEKEEGSAEVDLRENLGGLSFELFDFEPDGMNRGMGSELLDVADGGTGLAPSDGDFIDEFNGLDGGGTDDASNGDDDGVLGVDTRLGVEARLEALAEK